MTRGGGARDPGEPRAEGHHTDRVAVDRLREAGFVGREWDGFAYQRARYAMDRLPWLIRSGEIWKKGRDRNLLGFANRYPGGRTPRGGPWFVRVVR